MRCAASPAPACALRFSHSNLGKVKANVLANARKCSNVCSEHACRCRVHQAQAKCARLRHHAIAQRICAHKRVRRRALALSLSRPSTVVSTSIAFSASPVGFSRKARDLATVIDLHQAKAGRALGIARQRRDGDVGVAFAVLPVQSPCSCSGRGGHLTG